MHYYALLLVLYTSAIVLLSVSVLNVHSFSSSSMDNRYRKCNVWIKECYNIINRAILILGAIECYFWCKHHDWEKSCSLM